MFNSYPIRFHFSVIPFVNHDYKNNNNQTLSVDFIVSCISLPSRFTTITITTNVTTLLCICQMVDLLFFPFDIVKRHAFYRKIVWKLIAHTSCIMHHTYSYLVSSILIVVAFSVHLWHNNLLATAHRHKVSSCILCARWIWILIPFPWLQCSFNWLSHTISFFFSFSQYFVAKYHDDPFGRIVFCWFIWCFVRKTKELDYIASCDMAQNTGLCIYGLVYVLCCLRRNVILYENFLYYSWTNAFRVWGAYDQT